MRPTKSPIILTSIFFYSTSIFFHALLPGKTKRFNTAPFEFLFFFRQICSYFWLVFHAPSSLFLFFKASGAVGNPLGKTMMKHVPLFLIKNRENGLRRWNRKQLVLASPSLQWSAYIQFILQFQWYHVILGVVVQACSRFEAARSFSSKPSSVVLCPLFFRLWELLRLGSSSIDSVYLHVSALMIYSYLPPPNIRLGLARFGGSGKHIYITRRSFPPRRVANILQLVMFRRFR